MDEQPDRPTGHPLLDQIHTGMTVFDRDSKEIGTVSGVYLGQPEEDAGQEEADLAARGSAEDQRPDPLPPGVPAPVSAADPALQDKLEEPQMLRGYLRVSGEDLPAEGEFIPAEQLDRVEDWRVFLNIAREE